MSFNNFYRVCFYISRWLYPNDWLFTTLNKCQSCFYVCPHKKCLDKHWLKLWTNCINTKSIGLLLQEKALERFVGDEWRFNVGVFYSASKNELNRGFQWQQQTWQNPKISLEVIIVQTTNSPNEKSHFENQITGQPQNR